MSLSRDDFGNFAVRFIQSQGDARPVAYDPKFFRLVLGDEKGPTSFCFLGHAYDETIAGEAAERVLARRLWSSIRRQGDAPVSLSLSHVLPRMRDLAFFSLIRRQAELEFGGDTEAIESVLLPHSVVTPELAVHLAYELPSSVSDLEREHLDGWKQPFDTVLAQSILNLRERSNLPWESPMPGVFISPYHDGFDASRMLLTEQLLALELKGAPVVMIPTHNTLFVTGEDDAQGLLQVATWCEEALSEPRGNTGFAFRFKNGAWELWLPPRESQAWPKLKMLQLQTLASIYARQKEVLEALLGANGHEIFVANMRAFRTTRGDIFTASAWTEGVDALLPCTDRVDFVRMPPEKSNAETQVWSTSWDIAVKTVGHLMEDTGDVPPRMRVTQFPEDALLVKMADEGALPKD